MRYEASFGIIVLSTVATDKLSPKQETPAEKPGLFVFQKTHPGPETGVAAASVSANCQWRGQCIPTPHWRLSLKALWRHKPSYHPLHCPGVGFATAHPILHALPPFFYTPQPEERKRCTFCPGASVDNRIYTDTLQTLAHPWITVYTPAYFRPWRIRGQLYIHQHTLDPDAPVDNCIYIKYSVYPT